MTRISLFVLFLSSPLCLNSPGVTVHFWLVSSYAREVDSDVWQLCFAFRRWPSEPPGAPLRYSVPSLLIRYFNVIYVWFISIDDGGLERLEMRIRFTLTNICVFHTLFYIFIYWHKLLCSFPFNKIYYSTFKIIGNLYKSLLFNQVYSNVWFMKISTDTRLSFKSMMCSGFWPI